MAQPAPTKIDMDQHLTIESPSLAAAIDIFWYNLDICGFKCTHFEGFSASYKWHDAHPTEAIFYSLNI